MSLQDKVCKVVKIKDSDKTPKDLTKNFSSERIAAIHFWKQYIEFSKKGYKEVPDKKLVRYKWIKSQDLENHLLKHQGEEVSIDDDSLLFKKSKIIEYLNGQRKSKKKKINDMYKTFICEFQDGNINKKVEILQNKNIVFSFVKTSDSQDWTVDKIIIKKSIDSALNVFDSLTKMYAHHNHKTICGKQVLFQNNLSNSLDRVWWKSASLAAKVLEQTRVFIFQRVVFESFHDFESLDQYHFMQQIQIALLNSGLLKLLVDEFQLESAEKLTYNNFEQKWFAVKLLFEVGYRIGVLLGDFVQFYYICRDTENNEKAKMMTMVRFVYDNNNFRKTKSVAFVFGHNSMRIKCAITNSGNKRIPFSVLKTALKEVLKKY